MGRYEAVLFDWMLTLAHYPEVREHLQRAHERLEREIVPAELDVLAERLARAEQDDEVAALMRQEDCSYAQHRRATMLLFERAELDPQLADAMYVLLADPAFYPIYDEVAEVLGSLAARGVRIAVVSDIHIDLRAYAEQCGISAFIDEWVLSFEHGVQKPDPAIFQLALDALGVEPGAALMVGDRASHDGAATAIGIDTLILPSRRGTRPGTRAAHSSRLDVVVSMVGQQTEAPDRTA